MRGPAVSTLPRPWAVLLIVSTAAARLAALYLSQPVPPNGPPRRAAAVLRKLATEDSGALQATTFLQLLYSQVFKSL